MKSTKLTIGKYILLSFLGLGLALSSCKKPEETVEPIVEPTPEPTYSAHVQKQVPIVLKETGELCPPCGGWGWTNWETLINEYEGDAFMWSNYSDYFVSNSFFVNGEMDPANSVMNAFQANFPYGGSKPLIYVNGVKVVSSTGTDQVVKSRVEIDASKNTTASNVNLSIAYKMKWQGDKLIVDAQAKLYNNMNGTYHMAVYIIEDKVKATQSGQTGTVEHHLAMRGSLQGGIWGYEFINGAATAGQTFEKSFQANIPSTYKKENITIGIIAWKKLGPKYYYENAATNQK